ncbi:hypothetical protein CPHLJ_1g3600 [Cryptosporidium parvum]
MSDSEDSWHSFLEPENLEDIFKKRILEYDPKLGLNISRNIRSRSLELIDTLILPLNKVDKDEISTISLPILKTIRRLVIIYSNSIGHLARLLEEIQTFEKTILFDICELEIIKNGTIEDLESDNNENNENIIRDVVHNFKNPIKRLRLKNIDLSIVDFLKLLQLDEFVNLQILELEDCEFEGIKRTNILESKTKISINSVKEFQCIRTDPIFARFFPNLKKVIYEANFSLGNDIYDPFQRYNNIEKGIGIEFFELRIPNNEISQLQFLENFFIGSFPNLENLRELRIVGNSQDNKDFKKSSRYEAVKQLREVNMRYYRENSFSMLKVLELRNLYIPLDTFDHLILMFSLSNNNSRYKFQGYEIEGNQLLYNYQKVYATYNLKFEDGSSKNHHYNINKYHSMSIQEESDFMLNSDYTNLGFSHPDDISCKNKNDYDLLGMKLKDKDNYNKNTKESSKINENGYMNNKLQNKSPFQHDSQVMQPFLDIKRWIINISKTKENNNQENISNVLYSLNTHILILDNQLQEMKYQSITEIHRNLISRTILEYLVDPIKTCLSISNSRIVLSFGFDNLIYSGYMLGVLFEYQVTLKELSALSFLIPIDFFCQLKLNRIQVLKVSLFKDKNLEPKDLIQLCSWIERYGKNLNYIHIRVTGSSSKWVPKETEITRLINLWKKMCPKTLEGKSQEKIKFECCFTDHIFSKMEKLPKDFEYDTESD